MSNRCRRVFLWWLRWIVRGFRKLERSGLAKGGRWRVSPVGVVVTWAQPVWRPGLYFCFLMFILHLLVIRRHFYTRNSNWDGLRRRLLILFTKELIPSLIGNKKVKFYSRSGIIYVLNTFSKIREQVWRTNTAEDEICQSNDAENKID